MEHLCRRFTGSYFFSFSYLKVNSNYNGIDKAKEIFLKILDDEISNKMPLDIIEEAKKDFNKRLEDLDWKTYCNDLPFNLNCLSIIQMGSNS